MTAVLHTSEEKHPRFPTDPSRCPITQRYFLDSPDVAMIKPSHIRLYSQKECPSPVASSAPSSIPPSPDFSQITAEQLPPTPTTLSSLSLSVSDDQDDDEEEIQLPSYDFSPFVKREETEREDTLSETSAELSTDLQRSSPPTPAVDDCSIEEEPSRHVDYLSHDWKEEDVWSSWRYVVARRTVYSNGVRLENASWRTWAKLKHNLGTVSPETLNWLKDCDVTWLYGPLKTCTKFQKALNVSPPPSCLETPTLELDRKPILKKRTASETILQRSLSQHTLLQHAGAILKAQEAGYHRGRPSLQRYTSELGHMFNQSSVTSVPVSLNDTPTNTASSGVISPSGRRHIHFNNEVVQCIAVEAKYGNEEDGEWPTTFEDDSSSDDGIVMMKTIFPRASASHRSTPRSSFGGENKTIAPLPSTTLKYRGDTPEPTPDSRLNGWAAYLSKSTLSNASSVETLRPSDTASNFFLDHDDDGLDFHWPPNQTQDTETQSHPWFVNPADEEEIDRDRASSGTFLQWDEGDSSNPGIFNRLVDTVNTARDIAHVIWNVGWRK